MHLVKHSKKLIKEMTAFALRKITDSVKNGIVIDDEWFTFNESIDINIFFDADMKLCASAYDVIDNNTITDSWTRLLPLPKDE